MWRVTLLVAALALYVLWTKDHFDPATLSGKRVLVTGASSGIGEHTSYEYSRLGARVVIAARRADRLEKVAKKCRELGSPQVDVVVADMAKAEDRDRLVEEVESRLGGLDVLILNHALGNPRWWKGTKDHDIFRRQFEVNFVSYVDIAAKALPMLVKSNGSVGVVSSIAGKIAVPSMAIYCSNTHALQGFFHSVRQEFPIRDIDISVTLAIIGPVDTELGGQPPEEIEKIKQHMPWYVTRSMETPQNTALAIIRGVTTKQPEIYFGKIAYIMVLINKICPWCSERMWVDFAKLQNS